MRIQVFRIPHKILCGSVSIDCSLMIRFGYSVVEVGAAVQQAITTNVEAVTGVKVVGVNVNVCGIVR